MKPPDPNHLPRRFDARSIRILEEAFRRDERPDCPVCGTTLDVSPVPRPPDVSYVRERAWAACPGCRRSAALERSRRS